MLMFAGFLQLKKINLTLGLAVIPIVFLILGHGYLSKSEPIPMSAAYRSPWLYIHVGFAWLAFGGYAIATGAAVILLIKTGKPNSKIAAKMPHLHDLDISSYQFVVLGYINHVVMLLSGSIWAKKLWGKYWGWDNLETWSLIAFLIYTFVLHARRFMHWKDRKGAWMTIIAIIIMAISYWGVGWFSPGAVHPGV